MKTLETPRVVVVTNGQIEALKKLAIAQGDVATEAIARVALGETVAAVDARFAHPVDARDECVRIITNAMRES